MAFLGSIGKFLGNIAKPALTAIAPAIAGFAQGGKAGAALGVLGSLTGGSGRPPTISPGPGIFSGFQTTLGGPFQFPQRLPGPMNGQAPVVMTGGELQITKSVFDIIIKLAARLGIAIKKPSAVVRIGRSIIAKLLRFARANPGLTIINLLLNLGLSAFEANEIITWWTTHGKRRRRIRVTNVKALNRSVRRLEGFRRLSHRVEVALSRRAGGRSVTRSRRCPRCRKNPCCC